MSVMGADALLGPLRAALRASGLPEAELWAHRRRAAITRYARSQIHQNALSDELHVHARAVVGTAVATVTTNGLGPEDLARALRAAADLASHLPPNEAWPGLADPRPVEAARAFDAATAALDAR